MNPARETILVTGSFGMIGSALIQRMGKTHRIIGFDKGSPPYPPSNAETIGVDLASDESVQRAFDRLRQVSGDRLASVVHLAAYYDFSGKASPLYDEITVRGTGRLVQGLREFDVDQFVFSSTMLVHAPCDPGRRIDETWPLLPKWDYPRSKVATERLLLEGRPARNLAILRIAGVYNDRCRSIPLAHQIQRILEKRLTGRVYPGDVKRGQAFVHLDDVTDALESCINRRRDLPEEATLLIGEDETLSYDELQRAFAQLIHQRDWKTWILPKWLAKAGAWLQDNLPFMPDPFIKPWMIDLADDHFALDIGRAEKMLGWRPARSLRDSLPKMIAALRADPLRWYRDNKLEPAGWLKRRFHPETRHGVST
jgi:nucleoside-diphosphate-sugar epimerase